MSGWRETFLLVCAGFGVAFLFNISKQLDAIAALLRALTHKHLNLDD